MTRKAPKADKPRYDQVEGEAFERYLLEVIRGWAAEQIRLGGADDRFVFQDARLVGTDYPHSEIEIDSVSTTNPDRKFTNRYPIDPVRDRDTAKQVAGKILEEIFD